ncbi:hypothetical protein STIAU_7708 [Stigmatella aurantiaca DW4/3-1]|uniref:Uncharacterized protein n=1 Tax=Stigmatella aurantiaca (strain DW4/3-1) TaxID=378806 RepID=Q098T8_STIAD|nr:hypothetical protein STIAU_7708 [Stigmatella aurantiaca DW4/3-1]
MGFERGEGTWRTRPGGGGALPADGPLLELLADLLLVRPLDEAGAHVVQLRRHLVIDELVVADLLNDGGQISGHDEVHGDLLPGPLGRVRVHVAGLLILILLGDVQARALIHQGEAARLRQRRLDLVGQRAHVHVLGGAVLQLAHQHDGQRLGGGLGEARRVGQRLGHLLRDELQIVLVEAIRQHLDGVGVLIGAAGEGARPPAGGERGGKASREDETAVHGACTSGRLVPFAFEAAAFEAPLVGQDRVLPVPRRQPAEALQRRARIIKGVELGLGPLQLGELRGVRQRGAGAGGHQHPVRAVLRERHLARKLDAPHQPGPEDVAAIHHRVVRILVPQQLRKVERQHAGDVPIVHEEVEEGLAGAAALAREVQRHEQVQRAVGRQAVQGDGRQHLLGDAFLLEADESIGAGVAGAAPLLDHLDELRGREARLGQLRDFLPRERQLVRALVDAGKLV